MILVVLVKQMARNQKGGDSASVITQDNSVRSNNSNNIIQADNITPSYGGYSMVTAESE